ncbi:MAG: PKD domain-containing protein [Bacteroidales bacterium]|nr:PKD domain-containing protein [Bacteroidales bacterium]
MIIYYKIERYFYNVIVLIRQLNNHVLKRLFFVLFIFILIQFNLFCQTKSFTVNLTSFSTVLNNEFSPVYYQDGIVFCTDLKNNSFITYNTQNQKLVNINYVGKKDSINWENSRIFSKELTTNFNDGPATFNDKGTKIYYSRNNFVNNLLREFSDSTNTMGIFSAENIDGTWQNIEAFPYNSSLYSVLTPSLTKEGDKIYFASDMPGGFGGTDLYYCIRNKNDWESPVNLGSKINTDKNESYPFISESGKLFFSSDGHPGFGGKDLFYSQQINGDWIKPIHLDTEINSPSDDFGLITDKNFQYGYFSSNRNKTDDIFQFTTDLIQFDQCDSMQENNYCYVFYDEHFRLYDTLPVRYEWDFGHGIIKSGREVEYCFSGPGEYTVKLRITDSLAADTVISVTSNSFKLEDVKQPYITSINTGIINKTYVFSGLNSNLPEFKISDYIWNFGKGFSIRGPEANYIFNKKGEYNIQLGLIGDNVSSEVIQKSCISKNVRIFDDYQELAMVSEQEKWELQEREVFNRFYNIGNGSIDSLYESISGADKNKSEILPVKIYLLADQSTFIMTSIDEEIFDLEGEIIGFKDAVLTAPSHKVIDKLVDVLKQYPEIKLFVATHTESKGSAGNNLEITEKWAVAIYSELLSMGIEKNRIEYKGFGESRPIFSKYSNSDERLNKRVEFIFIKE